MDWVKSSFEILEKIPSVAWRWSIVFLVLGGVLDAGMRVDFIPDDAINGYVQEATPVLITLGIGLLLIGLISNLISLFQSHRERSVERGRILDNVRFVPPDALPILYIALSEPRGRIPSPGDIACCRRLQQLEIMSPEDAPWRGLQPGNMLTVASPVFKKRRKLVPQIAAQIEKEFGVQVSDEAALGNLLQATLSKHRRMAGLL